MSRQKTGNLVAIFFLTVISCMGGCSYYQSSSAINDKPPYAHGHIEEEPGPRHERLHTGETKGSYEKSEINKVSSTSSKRYGVISIEKNAPGEIQAGKFFDYLIKINNLTGEKVKDVEVTETFSRKYKLKNSIPKIDKSAGDGSAKWFIGDLRPNETREIRVTGIAMETGDMPFCTDVTYNLPPLCVITNVVQPKLKIAKHAPAEVLLCETIPITLVVTNTGTGVAQNIQVKDSLPIGWKTTDGESSVVREIGMLKPGESKEITLTVKADRTGKFNNTASLVADGGLSSESGITTTVVRQPVLTISKTGPERTYTGRNITYNIVVNNKGDGAAASSVIEDIIPRNASFVSASQGGILTGNTVAWNIGTLEPRGSRKTSITLRDNGLGEVKNTATVKATCAKSASASVTTHVLGIAAILLEVIDTEDPIEVGNNETYVITVTNQGSDYSTNIRIACTLEDTMQYVSSSGPTQGTSADGKMVLFAPLPSLAPKAKAIWKVIVKAINPGDVRFKVDMIEDCLKRPVEETEATNFYK